MDHFSRLLGGAAAAMFGTAALAQATYSDWTDPASIESAPGASPALNTPAVDGCASQSADGLTLFFNSNRTGNQDIYMARRASRTAGFGPPARLPAPVNSEKDDFCPTFWANQLYFSSARDDPNGDLYRSRMVGNGWGAAIRLGPNVNTSAMEESAAFYQTARGATVMLFSRRMPDGSGGKIFEVSGFGAANVVAGGTTSSGSDNRPSISPDGLTIYFDSVRPGTLGGPDLYSATRSSPLAAFGPALHLMSLSSPAFDARPYISADGRMLTFSSNRPGSESPAPDMWMVTRTKQSPR